MPLTACSSSAVAALRSTFAEPDFGFAGSAFGFAGSDFGCLLINGPPCGTQSVLQWTADAAAPTPNAVPTRIDPTGNIVESRYGGHHSGAPRISPDSRGGFPGPCSRD